MMSQDPEQRETEIERRVQERVALLLENNSMLPDMLASSVERAMRRVLSDQELGRQFWARGYEELSNHVGNNASQWIGRRLLTTAVLAATTAGIVWLVKTGALK